MERNMRDLALNVKLTGWIIGKISRFDNLTSQTITAHFTYTRYFFLFETSLVLCHIIAKNRRLINFKMFESIVTNIKRKFSKTLEQNNDNKELPQKTGFKRSLHLFKSKVLKSEPPTLVDYCDDLSSDLALSPRATGIAECAETEIEWPNLTDNHPNILDRFTRIVTITDSIPQERKVCL